MHKRRHLGKAILCALSYLSITTATFAATPYTLLDPQHYRHIVTESRQKIQRLLTELKPLRTHDENAQIAYVIAALSDTPYSEHESIGEGDWQPQSLVYQPGAVHINQNPVYRLDYLDCQTFVQIVMALLYSNTLDQFDQRYITLSYGAAGNPKGDIVRYFNRNNFVDGDMNPINEKNGFFIDATTQGALASYAHYTASNIQRQNWFLFQGHHLNHTVYVLNANDGLAMADRYTSLYSHLPYPHFDQEHVKIAYISKYDLATPNANGGFSPNQTVLDKIPTPSVMEIVSNVKKWDVGGRNIKDLIGTELNVPHLGILYRQTFHQGELIYQKTYCHGAPASCETQPVYCKKSQCRELMFAHATHIHPDGFYWYQLANGDAVCSAHLPAHGTHYGRCNRVTALPLYDYLTEYQFGSYWNMNNPTILGIHLEKLASLT